MHAQLAILADALTSVIDLAASEELARRPADELVERVADLAASALMAAATYGPLPPPERPGRPGCTSWRDLAPALGAAAGSKRVERLR